MAQTATQGRFGSRSANQFPILFEDGRLRVYKNPANEIFVEDITSGVTMRIHSYPYPQGGLRFTTDALMQAAPHNGGVAWEITRRPR